MANTQDGGRIVIGVRDSEFVLVGLSETAFSAFNQTKVNYFLKKYTDPKHSVQVHKEIVGDDKRVVVIDVPEFKATLTAEDVKPVDQHGVGKERRDGQLTSRLWKVRRARHSLPRERIYRTGGRTPRAASATRSPT